MNITKPIYVAFIGISIITLLVAIFMEKVMLLYVQPLTVIAITIIYFSEKKDPVNILYLLSQAIFIAGSILLILGMRYYVKEVSILFSFFYVIYLRLMYKRNFKKKATVEKRTYIYLVLYSLPVLYIYYYVIRTIYAEVEHVALYFGILVFSMLSYVFTAIYYYIKDKTPSNLWMLIAAVNLGFMNIIIALNELYMYDTIFTIISVFCSLCMQFFVLKFMLDDDENGDLLSMFH